MSELHSKLILNNYPHIQFIHFQQESLQYISHLIISNLPELKYLTIEDESFWSTTSLTLSSIFELIQYNELIFLIYLHSLQAHIHSIEQLMLLYQVHLLDNELMN